MSIQFMCPSCQQPIEVDDEWASASVTCPYCNRTVAAPAESTFTPAPSSPMARVVPVDEGPTSPWRQGLAGNPAAVWALALGGLWLVSYVGMMLVSGPHITEIIGENGDPQEFQRYMHEHASRGKLPGWAINMLLMFLLGAVFWVAGLVCAIIALRRPARRRLTILALVVLSIGPVLFCYGMVGARPGTGSAHVSHPAKNAASLVDNTTASDNLPSCAVGRVCDLGAVAL